jgi:hypothetical protein
MAQKSPPKLQNTKFQKAQLVFLMKFWCLYVLVAEQKVKKVKQC